MTPYEQELLEEHLTHLNVVCYKGDYPDFESWYQAVRYAQGATAPQSLEEAAELRYKDALQAAKAFNQLQETERSGSQSK